MSLKLSKSEAAAKAGVKALQRGRATTIEAGHILGVTQMTVLNRIKRGTIASFKMGKKNYIDLRELVRIGAVLPSPSNVEGAKTEGFDFTDLSEGAQGDADEYE